MSASKNYLSEDRLSGYQRFQIPIRMRSEHEYQYRLPILIMIGDFISRDSRSLEAAEDLRSAACARRFRVAIASARGGHARPGGRFAVARSDLHAGAGSTLGSRAADLRAADRCGAARCGSARCGLRAADRRGSACRGPARCGSPRICALRTCALRIAADLRERGLERAA
jgi:hypothetical protein